MTDSLIRPSQFIQRFERRLGSKPHRILDIGCHLGRNSLYLSRLGHDVVAVDPTITDTQTAKQLAQQHAIENCRFIIADGRKLPFKPGAFSAVIANEMLHLLAKKESQAVLASAQEKTAPGGLNAVSGYFVGSETFEGDKGRYLVTNELAESYTDAGWLVVDYHEQVPHGEMVNGQFFINSLATIIARKPYN